MSLDVEKLLPFECLNITEVILRDVVECLPLDPAAQVRFPPRAVGIFLHPVHYLMLSICLVF